jgi:glyoxylase-like metal-dependent hydrolase (beta-lactamase superfamily II)
MQRLFENVFIIDGEIGGRPLQLVYLRGTVAAMLLDTGCAADPREVIAPQIREAGGNIEDLTWILSTHPDLDHIGGNYAAKQLAPKALLACGDADRHICTGLDALLKYRYDVYRADHQIFHSGDKLARMKALAGPPQPIDVTFRGGRASAPCSRVGS